MLLLDAQATGATPAHGDLLELAFCIDDGAIVARHLVPVRPVSRIVRKLTGWNESLLEGAVDAEEAWRELLQVVGPGPVPTLIHWARFELPFLRDLHARAAPDAPFPLDVVCLHAIAARLFPDLPRRNLRALAGFLGHSPELLRRAEGHVEATRFVWNALAPRLGDWSDLKTWVAAPAPRPAKRAFPLAPEKRRALPDAPGVYRFLRSNGDVLYVGKATSLRRRVNSHFVGGTERALEMLTQAHDVSFTATGSALEAALLEADEIKRIDPPYNVHLREQNRAPAFASRDWARTSPLPDAEHPLGPLPSARAIAGIAALRRVLEGAPLDDELRAAALGVAPRWAPPAEMFDPVLEAFVTRELSGGILSAGLRLTSPEPDPSTEGWNPERIERGLVRTVVEESALLRRARALALLTDCHITFREAGGDTRTLALARGELGAGPRRPRAERLASVTSAATYDRLRVLLTELTRIVREGGEVDVRIGAHSSMRYPRPVPTPDPKRPGQESVWEYPRPPRIEPTTRRIRVVANGETLVDTRRALRVLETSHPPVYYVPLADVREGALVPSARSTFCEFKGGARYFDVGGARDAAWTYDDGPLRDHVAFYARKMGACFVDDEQVRPQEGEFYGGWITSDLAGPFKGGPGTHGW